MRSIRLPKLLLSCWISRSPLISAGFHSTPRVSRMVSSFLVNCTTGREMPAESIRENRIPTSIKITEHSR